MESGPNLYPSFPRQTLVGPVCEVPGNRDPRRYLSSGKAVPCFCLFSLNVIWLEESDSTRSHLLKSPNRKQLHAFLFFSSCFYSLVSLKLSLPTLHIRWFLNLILSSFLFPLSNFPPQTLRLIFKFQCSRSSF